MAASSAILSTAIRAGNSLETIKKLVENGASVNDLNNFEYPLDVAVDKNNAEIVTFLLKYVDYDISETRHRRGKTLLHRACKAKPARVEIVRGLLEYGINVNAVDQTGETALHPAAQCYNKEIVQLLIDYGIDINYVDENSRSPYPAIYNALLPNYTETLELLLKYGAEVYTTTSAYKSLLLSADSRFFIAAKILLRYLVNLCSQFEINWNTLSNAIFEDNINLVKELLANEHEIDMLCLYTAVVCDNYEILELIWKNIASDLVSNDWCFMIHVFDNFRCTEKINKLCLLLYREDVDLHLERCGKAFAFFLDRIMEEVFQDVSRSEYNELVYCFASRGLRLSVSDAERIISLAGRRAPTELIEDIIYMTSPKITRRAFLDGAAHGMDELLIQLCLDVNFHVLLHCVRWNADSLHRYLGLFTATYTEKKWLIRIMNDRIDSEELDRVNRILDSVNFKSLVELSRDVVRRQLNDVYIDNWHLLHILDQLQLPSIVRDIIQCKVPVNLLEHSFS